MFKKMILGCVAGFLGTQIGFADDPAAVVAKKPWTNSTEVSAVNTTGNTRTTSTSAKESFTYEWTKTSLNLNGSALGASERSGVTAEEYTAGEKGDLKLSTLDYLYELFHWDSNRFAGFRDQYNSSAGYGRKLLMLTHDLLNAEIGAGYLNEQRINAPRNDFATGRAYLKYVHLFTPLSSFSQDVEYIHNFQSVNGYHLNTETALTATLTTHLSLKTSYTWNRINQPAPGAGKDDTKLLAALVITY
jgi:putative salt-induced outer membrane protein